MYILWSLARDVKIDLQVPQKGTFGAIIPYMKDPNGMTSVTDLL